MTYASQQDLVERYGERMIVALTDRGETATGLIDADVVARALTDTNAVIDGYLAARYALPLAETPAMIADLALAIAIWKLHPAAPDPKIETDYKDAIRTLRDISTGTVRIPGAAGAEPPGTGTTGARVTDRERPMSAETLKGFI